MWSHHLFLFIVACMVFVDAVKNVTVDDTSPLITYSPASVWGPGNNCEPPVVGCLSGLDFDNSAASNKTWHYALSTASTNTEPFSAQLTFNGTAVFVFGIDASSLGIIQALNLFVDGGPGGSITTSGKDNLFFSLTNLKNGEHTVRLETAANTAQQFITLDHFIYTEDDTSATPTGSTLPTPISTTTTEGPAAKSGKGISGPVIGGIVVAIIVALALAFLGFFLIRRNRSRRSGALRNAVLNDDERPLPRGPTLVEPYSISTGTGVSGTRVGMGDPATEKTRTILTSEPLPSERRSSMTKGPTSSPSEDAPPPILSPLLQTSQNADTNVQPRQQDLDNVPLEALMINLAARGVPVPGDAVPPAYASM